MAKYQILYWHHIPLSVRATDENGTVTQVLSGRFIEALKRDTDNYKVVMHSSHFKWGQENELAGAADEVAAAIVLELNQTWDEAEALAIFKRNELYRS